MENYGVPFFFAPPQQASQYTLPEKPTKIHWLRYDNNVPFLNAMKILTVRLVENLKFFYIHQYLVCLLDCHKTH